MDRTACRWFACLVATPLGLMPVSGCGSSSAEPSASVQAELAPPQLLPRAETVYQLREESPRAVLAEHVGMQDALRRLPPVEYHPSADPRANWGRVPRVANSNASNAAAGRWENFEVVPLPPVTEAQGAGDATPYVAQAPRSVVARPGDEPRAAASDDDGLPDLSWPSESKISDEDRFDAFEDDALEPVEDEAFEPKLDAALEIEEPATTSEMPLLAKEHPSAAAPALTSVPSFGLPMSSAASPAPPELKEAPAEEQGLALVPGPTSRTPQPTAASSPAMSERARAMRIISQQAAIHVRRGMSLASRNASYSARSEFIQALRLISQALDVANNSHEYTEALASGLRALEEADDFAPHGTQLEADLNLAAIVRSHRTPTLKEVDPASLRPIFARQAYYNYAQRQLAHSVEGDRAGSMALYGLAKMRASLAQQQSERSTLELPKAMALYQAAMLVDGENYMASNELGVLLARYGQFESARSMFEHSISVQPQSATWHNLAVVYQQLGQTAQVAMARRKQAELTQAQRVSKAPADGIVWKSADDFNRSTARTLAPTTHSPAKTAQSGGGKSSEKK